jgi:CRP-like cAMP-binding protein
VQHPDRARGGYGLLVLEGLLLRRVGIEGRYGAELLGPGDLLRPWQRDVNVLAPDWSYGRVHPDGVHLDLPLTHEALSHLAGARRPSVSGALTRLAADGRLRREGRRWVLHGEPPVVVDSTA